MSGTPQIRDADIRAAVRHNIIMQNPNDSDLCVLDEIGLRHGAARIDIFVVNHMLHGFELKSDRDTLRRLPRQVTVYGDVLDKVTLVVTRRHLEQSMRSVPDWWGVELAEFSPEGVLRISELRRALQNPAPNLLAVVKLLWRDEALACLENLSDAKGFRSKPRDAIYRRLAETVAPDTLGEIVRYQLRRRQGWRSEKGRRPSGGL